MKVPHKTDFGQTSEAVFNGLMIYNQIDRALEITKRILYYYYSNLLLEIK